MSSRWVIGLFLVNTLLIIYSTVTWIKYMEVKSKLNHVKQSQIEILNYCQEQGEIDRRTQEALKMPSKNVDDFNNMVRWLMGIKG